MKGGQNSVFIKKTFGGGGLPHTPFTYTVSVSILSDLGHP